MATGEVHSFHTEVDSTGFNNTAGASEEDGLQQQRTTQSSMPEGSEAPVGTGLTNPEGRRLVLKGQRFFKAAFQVALWEKNQAWSRMSSWLKPYSPEKLHSNLVFVLVRSCRGSQEVDWT